MKYFYLFCSCWVFYLPGNYLFASENIKSSEQMATATLVNEVAKGVELIKANVKSHKYKLLRTNVDQITTAARKNNQALQLLLQLFESNLNNVPVTNQLLVALTAIKQPEVEQLAQSWANGVQKNKKLLGLEILSSFQISSQKYLALALNVVCNEKDDEIIEAGMAIFPKITLSEAKNVKILNCLALLSKHQNDSIRSNSLFLVSHYAKNMTQLSSVVDALNHPEPDDRISAVMALEQSTVIDPMLKELLISKMLDADARSDIRSIAASALKRFSLNKIETKQLETFKLKQDTNGL